MIEPRDDLFEHTKMSFGEHLEELRGAIFRALIGLVIGTLISLLFAKYVIAAIEKPLTEALDRFYAGRTLNDLEDVHGEIDDRLASRIEDDKLTYELRYIERDYLAAILRDMLPNDGNTAQDPDHSPDDPSDDGTVRATSSADFPVGDELSQDVAYDVPPPRLDDWIPIRLWSYQHNHISALGVPEVFVIWMKAGLISGLVLSSPWVFWQLWSFVAAGLYPHEKSYVYTFVPVSLVLFFLGVALAYFFVFKFVLDFLFSFNAMVQIDPEPRISEWMSFVLLLPVGFGIAFQLPLVMFVLERVGIFDIATYLEKWRIAVLIIFVISMLLTPADPISMLLMALPLTVLYFGGIAMCQFMPRKTSPFGEVDDP